MTYQQLQAMNSTYQSFSDQNTSMSDYNEWTRWMEAHGTAGEELGEPVYDPDGDAASKQLFGPNDS